VEVAVRRTLSLILILALLPAACSREEQKVPQGKRPARMPAPTREEIVNEQREELLKKLDPVEKLEKGVNFETPDGEKWVRYPNLILVHDLKPGDGPEAQWGQTVRIAYALSLPGSEKVLERARPERPMEFVVGTRDVIKGMNMGVMGMRVGTRRRLFVPPELAYGKGGQPTSGIGPDQALIFEIDLLSVAGEPIAMPNPVSKIEPMGPPAPATAPATGPRGDGVMNRGP
jgi:FKBP-type peptidyl-prolyl cis-trans isomerase